MASVVEVIVEKVGNIMEEMRTNPVANIVTRDVKACLKKFMDIGRISMRTRWMLSCSRR